MEFHEALRLRIDDKTTDRNLDEAWLAAGAYKLRLRQLCFDSKKPVRIQKLYPALRQANELIDRIWNQWVKRATFEWYFRLPPEKREGLIDWDDRRNYLRNWDIPSVILPGKTRI